jgi:tRNA A-37 threonylcarbamoyl transferase component Bud32
VVTAVPGDAIERCASEFLAAHAGDDGARRLTDELARLAAALHGAGFVHRDLYASHVFLHESDDNVSLYLIDLARMFAPRRRTFRWRVKDLAQLKYSMPASWVQSHWDAFLAAYLAGCPGREEQYSRAIDRKEASIRRRALRRARRRAKGAPER